jgi:hypothetical protein
MEGKPNQKPEEKEQSSQKSHLQVKIIPKGIFQLFNKNDTYIYEKKFSCDLPKNIIPPKSFHYPFSLENYCQSDLLTMDFDLKKNPEILTDSKINTLIHQDFINNTLELIFPNLTTISKKRTEEEQKFKKKIIEIIERNEESSQEINPELNVIPDFLRRQTYLRPSTAYNLDNKSKLKDKSKNDKKQRTSLVDLKTRIDQTFIDIDKIKEGMKHPDTKQKGLTAKKVYEVSPMDDMPNIKFVEYLFPTEPSQVINLNEKYLKPEKFLIKMNETNDISGESTCSFFINNKLKTQEDHKDKDRAEYYSYETDFTSNKINESDLFNRYFFILDKVNKKLKISQLSEKYALRRYKRIMEENIIDENNKIIGKKRRRNVITVPQSMQKEELDKKKKWISERGYNTHLIERKIESVDHSDVMEIEKEKEIEEEEERKRKIENQQEENNEEEGIENENEDDEDIYNQNEQQNEEENDEDNNEEYGGDNENNNDNDNEVEKEEDQQQKEESLNENENEGENENENNEENENKDEEENNGENNEEKEEQNDSDDEKDEDIFD